MARPKVLYHYTSPVHVPAILETGFLKVTESNVSFKIENAAPQVVWLTPETLIRPPKYLASIANKTAYRFVVAPADAQRSDKWLRCNGASSEQIRLLEEAGGGTKATRWYVVARPIPREEWLALEMREGNRWIQIYSASDLFLLRAKWGAAE